MNYIQKVNAYLKKGSYPAKHAYQVVRILKQVTTDTNILAAGLLHDVLEDTDVTFTELLHNTNPIIAGLVWEVTKTGPNEFKNLKSLDAIRIKFADRLSNLSDMKPWDDEHKKRFIKKSVFWKE